MNHPSCYLLQKINVVQFNSGCLPLLFQSSGIHHHPQTPHRPHHHRLHHLFSVSFSSLTRVSQSRIIGRDDERRDSTRFVSTLFLQLWLVQLYSWKFWIWDRSNNFDIRLQINFKNICLQIQNLQPLSPRHSQGKLTITLYLQ